MKPNHGDFVRVHTLGKSYEGVLIPRPEIFNKGCIVIKLASGYNIGIDEKNVRKIEVIEKYKPKNPEITNLAFRKELPLVSILSFGGTISSKIDYRTGGVYADYTAQDFVRMLPELSNIANLKAEKVMGIMSEDMCPGDWQLMAGKILKEINDDKVDGVVVTQGTDTLHYSTSAISFFIREINKPVVFTAAQRSIDRASSDAFLNLFCAVNAAAKFDGAAVVTCMHGSMNDDCCLLNRGTKVRKMHTSRRDAFRPINELPLGKVHESGQIEIINSNYIKRNNGKAALNDKFEDKTALVYVYPGMNPEVLDYFHKKKFRGVVIAGTALGHVPTINPKFSLQKKLKKLIVGGTSVVISTQAIYGRVHPYVYTNLRKLSVELDCIYAQDMLAETAYVKLGWVLGNTDNPDEIRKMMLTNYAGEISERSDDKSFLF